MAATTRVIVARDLFVDNDVYVLSRSAYPRIPALGGVAWLERQPPRSAHLSALTAAVAAVGRALPAYRLSLLVAHTAVQPDNRITRHRRLWKSLEAGGVGIPRGARTDERSIAERDGLRWFGAVAIGVEDVPAAMAVVHREPASLLVAVPASALDRIDDLIARGWTSRWEGPPPEVLDWLGPDDGIVLRPVGAFDDPESGVVAFCPPGIVELVERSSARSSAARQGA